MTKKEKEEKTSKTWTLIQYQNEMVLLARTNFEKQLRETQPTIFILVSQCILYF